MPVLWAQPALCDGLLGPNPEPTSDKKGSESCRQEVKDKKRRQEGQLLRQILAQRVLARQSSGGNFGNQENQDCRSDGRNSPYLYAVAKKITHRRANYATQYDWNEK